MKRLLTLICLLAIALPACTREEKFSDIGDRVVSPVSVVTSKDGNYFFVLNADAERIYNEGSILILDSNGTKINTVKVPRMGRTLHVSGDDLLITFDYPESKHNNIPKVLLYNITDPANPVQKQEWDIDCSPYNAVMRQDYPYFALTCTDGSLFLGELTADRAQSTLKKVRNYAYSRRAIHIDTKRNLILGFTTDNYKKWNDRTYQDVASFNELGDQTAATANEVPDLMENSKRGQSNAAARQVYQFFVYNIERERSPENCLEEDGSPCKYPFRTLTDPVVKRELRWLYFNLRNFDGTPDDEATANDPSLKFYRTNFWQAQPDPDDADAFYLSHRGVPSKSPYANQIVRVRIIGDLAGPQDPAAPVPPTGETLSFERAYGFKGAEASPFHFAGDFVIRKVQGQKIVLVNHFRDLYNWDRSEAYYSLAAKSLDEPAWFAEQTGTLTKPDVTTFFTVAMNDKGRAMSCSFYGDKVILLDVTPGVGITEHHRIQ